MRTASIPAPATWPEPGTHQRFIELDLHALTPIYKGGSTTDKIDGGRPFRPSSIRGALRYWWRAASAFEDVATLRDREQKLFGGVHGDRPVASEVSVAVLDQTSTPGPRPGNKPYAFGVTGREPEENLRNKQVHKDATGKLRVEWRDHAVGEDVKRALETWLLFGGTGGRSRRGAGSVWWSGGMDVPTTVDAYVTRWRSLAPKRSNAPWPMLAGGVLLIGPARPTADEAWIEGLDRMKDVRASQGVRLDFTPRRGADLLEWKRRDYIPISKGQSFQSPRAVLGLPIRFMGKGGQGLSWNLNAIGHDRYPSPIHLKIIQLGDANHHSVFVVLRGPAPTTLSAKSKINRVTGQLDRRGLDRFIELATQLPEWTHHDLGGAR